MLKPIALAITIAVAPAVPAFADSDDHGRLNVPRADWLSAGDVVQKLAVQGYTVREIEADDGAYEFEAVTQNGVRIEGYAHPATGEVLRGYDD